MAIHRMWMAEYLKNTADRSADMPSDDSAKHVKFRELAESRTNKALDAIARIGNLSNRSLYEWEDAEVRKGSAKFKL